MVTAVSVSLSSVPRSARMPARTPHSVSTVSTASVRRRPRNSGPLKGVVAMVDVRVGADAQIDCSDVVARKLRELGASTVKRLTPKLTHMVLSHFTPAWKTKIAKWQGSGGSMAAAATRYGLKIVSQLWVNACYVSKKRMDERPFFPVSQQILVENRLSTAKLKLPRRQSLGSEKRRLSLGVGSKAIGNDMQARNTTGAITGDRMEAASTPLSSFKNYKALNRSRRKRALSMEPMTSDAIIQMLGATIEVAEFNTPTKQPTQSKRVSSSAKRRKTLNGPLTQQDEDEVTVSQTSGFVAESESEHEIEGKEKANEVVVIPDSQNSCQPSQVPLRDSLGLSASSSTPTTSSGDIIDTSPDNDHKKRPTARELRRHNRNSLSYGSGLTLKSGIWSCKACGCSNPRSSRYCSDCQVSRGLTKSPGNESSATFLPATDASTVADSPKTPDTPTASALNSVTPKAKTPTPTKVSTTSASVSNVEVISGPSVIERTSRLLARPTVSSAAKARLSSPSAVRTMQPVSKNKGPSPATKLRTQSPADCSPASNQAMRSSLASASIFPDMLQTQKHFDSTDASSAMDTVLNAGKKRARTHASNSSLTTPAVKKMRRDIKKESSMDRPMATPGSVSGFKRKHRDVN